ncbi:hypothetical protein ACQR1I_36590 [Bradyrhizobium sp. HKCCYLS2038]
MTRTQVSFLGALGGILPVLVSMVTVDLAPIINDLGAMSPGIYIE